jgi:hypothetical protein
VIATDIQSRVNFMNSWAETLTGWRQAEALLAVLIIGFAEMVEMYQAVISTERPQKYLPNSVRSVPKMSSITKVNNITNFICTKQIDSFQKLR